MQDLLLAFLNNACHVEQFKKLEDPMLPWEWPWRESEAPPSVRLLQTCVSESRSWTRRMGPPSPPSSNTSACSTSSTTWRPHASWSETTYYLPVSAAAVSPVTRCVRKGCFIFTQMLHPLPQEFNRGFGLLCLRSQWVIIEHDGKTLRWPLSVLCPSSGHPVLFFPSPVHLSVLGPSFTSDWLSSMYKNQWFAMLRTEFDNDNG